MALSRFCHSCVTPATVGTMIGAESSERTGRVAPMLICKKLLRDQEPLGVMCVATGALGPDRSVVRGFCRAISVDLEKLGALW